MTLTFQHNLKRLLFLACLFIFCFGKISSVHATSTGDGSEVIPLGNSPGNKLDVGSGMFVVDGETGNVGIGTSVPAAKFEVFGTISATNFVGSGAGLTAAAGWVDGGANVYTTTLTDNVGIGTSVTSAGKLIIQGAGTTTGISLQTKNSSATAKVTILDNGNIGIGSTLPAGALDVQSNVVKIWTGAGTDTNATSAGELYVEGDLEVDGTIYGDGSQITGINAAGGWTDGGTIVYNTTNSDNVGIGTSANGGKLTIKGAGTTTGIGLQTQNSSGTAQVTILDNGNIGIGSTNPAANLQLASGSIYLSSGAKTTFGGLTEGIRGSNQSYVSLQTNSADRIIANYGGGIDFQNESSGKLMSITSAGNVGVGTSTPQNLLDVRGSAAIGTYAGLNAAPSDGLAVSGAVGIGTSAPTGNLDVRGDEVRIWTGAGTDTNATSAGELYVEGDLEVDGTIYGDGSQLTGISAAGGWTDGGTIVYNTTNSDNVGIGTSANLGKLGIKGAGTTTGINFQTQNSSATALITAQDSGNFGIGSSVPSGKLIVQGAGTTTGIAFRTQDSSAAAKVTMLDSGNVGIGSSLPAGALDVQGNAVKIWTGAGTDSNATSSGELYVEGDLEVDGTVYMGSCSGAGCGAAASGWTDGGTSVYNTTLTDNVGVGTSNTNGKLIVQGVGTTTGVNFQTKDSSATPLVTLLDNGNVGIGSTNPTDNLSISGNGATLALRTTSNPNNYYLKFTSNYDTVNPFSITTYFNAEVLAMYNGNTYLGSASTRGAIVILDANGAVGIGTSAPTGQLDVRGDEVRIWTGAGTDTNATSAGELYVEGDLEVDGTIYGDGSQLTGISAAGGWTDGGTSVYNTTLTDNVGVGTSNTNGKLIVQGAGTTTGLAFQTKDSSATAKVSINDAGNVGIGSTVPQASLVVGSTGQFQVSSAGAVSSVGIANITSAITNNNGYTQSGTTANTFTGTSTFSNATNSAFFSGGNVGYGTTNATGIITIQGAGTTTGIAFQTKNSSATSKVVMLDSGNVGIGSSLPNGALDVQGNAVKIWTGAGTDTNATSAGELYVEGDLEVDGTIYGDGSQLTGISAAGGWTDGGTSVYNTTLTDNVGIGTSNTNGKLIVQGAGTTTGLAFQTKDSSATAKVSINDAGNVGIGSTVPQASLVVGSTGQFQVSSAGAVSSVGIANITSAITNNNGYTQSGTTANTFTGTSTFSNATNSAFFSGGNVGYGTTNATGIITIQGAGTTTGIAFQTKNSSATSKVVMLDSGNVGIGSSLPAGALDVQGNAVKIWTGAGTDTNATASGELYVEGDLEVDGTVYMGSCSGAGCGAGASGWTDGGTSVYNTTLTDNVGVGTSNTNGKLIVQGAGTTTGINFQTKDSSASALVTALDNGNAGIGSSVPDHRLIVSWKSGDTASTAFFGANDSSNTQTAVVGISWDSTGVFGQSVNYEGVQGYSFNGTGVLGFCGAGIGIKGISNSSNSGYFQSNINTNTAPTLVTRQKDTATADLFQAQNDAGTALTVINVNGNVGIGTSVPTGALDVRGDEVRIWTGAGTDTNATSSGELYVEGDLEVDGTVYMGSCSGAGCGAGSSGWTDGGTIVYNTTASDNVAIGTTANGGKLTVKGAGSTTGIGLQMQDSSGAALLTSLDNGNVGIGSTVPNSGLIVAPTIATADTYGMQIKPTDNRGSGSNYALLVDNFNNGSNTTYDRNGVLVWPAGGNNSIGLQVNSTTTGSTGVNFSSVGGTYGMQVTNPSNVGLYVSGAAIDAAYFVLGSNQNGLKIDNNGCCGTSTGVMLELDGLWDHTGDALVMNMGQSGNAFTGNFINLKKNSVSEFVVNSGGNLGIGTSTPQNLLDVRGSAAIGTYAGLNAAPSNGLAVSGAVGIGTSAPTGNLDVRGDEVRIWTGAGTDTNATSAGELYVEGDLEVDGTVYMGSCSGAGCSSGTISNGATGAIPRYTAATTLDDSGVIFDDATNIGIGTSTTTGKLTLKGSGSTTGILLRTQDSSNNAKITILDSGNMGIGSTVPFGALDVQGNAVRIWTGAGTDTNATSSGELYVQGDLEVDGTIYGDGSQLTGISAAGGWTDGGTSVYNTTLTDNVGVGTSNTNGKFIVQGAGTTTGINFQTKNSSATALVTMLDGGNVGIGTTVPGYPLEVIRNANDSATSARVTNTDSGSLAQASFSVNNGTNVGSFAIMGTGHSTYGILNPGEPYLYTDLNLDLMSDTASGVIKFATGGPTEKMRIDANGNLGIGSSTPKNLLDVRGSAAIGTYAGLNAAPSNGLAVSGAVGIGTSAPTGNLDVRGDEARIWTGAGTDTNATSAGELYVEGDLEVDGTIYGDGSQLTGISAAGGWTDGGTNVYNTTATDNVGIGTSVLTSSTKLTIKGNGTTTGLGFQTQDSGGTVRVSINDAGNVGIGSTVPQAPLTVGSTGQFQVSSAGAVTSVGHANTGSAITNNNAYTQSGTSANTFTGTSTFSNGTNSAFFSGGNVGYGTTNATGIITIQGAGTTTGIAFQTKNSSATSKVVMLDSGNVGIGSSLPNGALDVQGNAVRIWTTAGTDTNATSAGELYVEGDLEVDGTIYGDGSQLTGISAAGGWTDGGTNVYNTTATDNIGIGTSVLTSSTKLTIKGNGTTTGLGFQTQDSSGTARVSINDAGNVGIGSTVPQAPLAVGSTGQFQVSSTGVVTSVGHANTGAAITNNNAYTQSGTTANTFTGTSTFSNATNSAFFSGGNVGYGTTNATGIITIQGAGTTTGIAFQTKNSSATSKVVMLDSGNVGIGSSLPNGALDVQGNAVRIWTTAGTDTNATSAGELYVEGDLEVDGTIYGDGSQLTGISAAGGWTDGGTNVYNTTATDNVGIGTSVLTSSTKLTVKGNGTTTGLGLQTQDSGGTVRVSIQDSGNVGIGSSVPTGKLIVQGAGTTTGITLQTQNSSATALITALDSGNVGLGTTVPRGKFGVVGGDTLLGNGTFNNPSANDDLYVTGNLEVDGTIYGDGSQLTGISAAGGWTDGGTNVYNTTSTDNVGIGTSVLTSSTKLTIKGNGTTTGLGLQTQDSSGTARVSINDAGNVGIGSTVPAQKLDIVAAGNNNNEGLIIRSNNLTASMSIGFSELTSTSSIRLSSNNSAVGGNLIVDLNGNVGIGTTVPLGRLVAQGAGTTTGITQQWQDSNAAVKMTVFDGGNVGIGTTINTGKLQIQGAGTTTGINLQTRNSSATALITAQDSGNVGLGSSVPTGKLIVQGAGTTTGVGFQTLNSSATPLVTMLDSGNLGIGTSVPVYAFDVKGDFGSAWAVHIQNTHGAGGGGSMTVAHGDGYGANIDAGSSATPSTSALNVNKSGTVYLYVQGDGNIGISSSVPTGKLIVQGTGTTTGITLQTRNSSGTAKVTMLDNGNVGIGSTVPAGALDVIGNPVKIWTGAGTDNNANSSGEAYVEGDLEVDGTLYMANCSGAGCVVGAGAGGWTDAGTAVYTSTSTDNVGIGTTLPSTRLDVVNALGNTDAVFGDWWPTYILHANPGIGFNIYNTSGYKFGRHSSASYGALIAVDYTTGQMDFSTTNSGNADATATLTARMSLTNGGNVGIGTSVPTTLLSISADGGWTTLTIAGAGTNQPSTIEGRMARNTIASPQAVQTDDRLLRFAGIGYDGTNYYSSYAAEVDLVAEENWSVGVHGSYIAFATTADGTASRSEKMRLTGSGNLGIGSTVPQASLTVGSTGQMQIASTGNLTVADGVLVDLSAVNASSTTEGLKLPQATSVSSSTAEGQMSWDTDDDILYVGDGAAAKAVNFWTTIKKTVTETTASNTGLTDDAVLKFNVAANGDYSWQMIAFFDTGAAGDFKWQITGPASPTLIRIQTQDKAAGATVWSNINVQTAFSTVVATTSTGTTGGFVQVNGILHNGANSGTVTFQWAQNSSSSTQTAVLKGSYLKWMKL